MRMSRSKGFKSEMRRRVSVRWFAAAVLSVLPMVAQTPSAPTGLPAQPGSRFPHDQNSNPGDPISVDQNRIKFLNRLRQKSIVDDAARLLILARELNAQVSSMSRAERVHKAAEIEKLAKSVKEKMSYAVGATPSTSSSFTLFP